MTKTAMPIADALVVARDMVGRLGPATERIAIAGSIRRGRPDIGDVELVAVPQLTTVTNIDVDLWGEHPRTNEVSLLDQRIDELLAEGVLAVHPTHPARGARYARLWIRSADIQLDLFTPAAASFGLILLIRTGPWDYSQRFVTDIRAKGYHVANGELHRGSLGCSARPCEVIPTPEEEGVYRTVGMPFVVPSRRDR